MSSGLVLAWGVIMLALGSFSQYAARHARRRLADAAGVIKHQSEVIARRPIVSASSKGSLRALNNCFSVGDRVKWAPDIAVSVWRGTVTAIEGEKCICDDRGRISAGLLALAEDEAVSGTREMLDVANAITARIAALEAERDALVDVIAMQAELIQPAGSTREQDATLQRLLDYYLLEVCGDNNPRLGETKLGALISHIRRFYR